MRPFFLQVAAVTLINLKSIPQRFWLSLSTVVAVALVVIVLLSFLAMANGFQHTLTSSGADDVAIVLRGGSQAEINSTVSREQVRLIEEGPGVARGSDGKPMVSAELYLVVDGLKRSSQTKANLPLRGIGKDGATVRKGIKILEVACSTREPTKSWSDGPCCASSRALRSAKRSPSRPVAGRWLGYSRPTAVSSSRRFAPISRWCRACSIAIRSCKPCACACSLPRRSRHCNASSRRIRA